MFVKGRLPDSLCKLLQFGRAKYSFKYQTMNLQVQPPCSESNLKPKLLKCPITTRVFSISDSHMSFWASLEIDIEHLNDNKASTKICNQELLRARKQFKNVRARKQFKNGRFYSQQHQMFVMNTISVYFSVKLK